MMEPVTLFVHIEKTGGISFRNILESNFSRDSLLKFYDHIDHKITSFNQLPLAEREKINVICGHMDFGVHNQLDIPDYRYITLLRDPVERMISFYYYFIKNPSEFTTYGRNHQLDFESYIRQGIHAHTDNGQTRRIAGVSHLGAGECDSSHLTLAKQNLEHHFSVIGTLDGFFDFLVMSKECLGLERIYYVQANKNTQRPAIEDVPKHIINFLIEYNQLDMELYAFAKTLIAKQIAAMKTSYKKEVLDLKSMYQKNQSLFRWFETGLKLFREGKTSDSETYFQRIIALKKHIPSDHEILVKSFFYLGELVQSQCWEKSQDFYKQSLNLLLKKNPKSDEETYLQASILKRLGRYNEALICFQDLIDQSTLKRFVSGACFHVGEIHSQLDEINNARVMVSRALELNPFHQKAKMLRDTLQADSKGQS